MAKETKKFRFEVKASDLQEDGTFTGLASTYGNVDQGNDVVDRGAFTKTLNERGAEVPILWSHDSKQPVGLGSVEDSAAGLVIKGKLNLETQIGRDVYSNVKARIVKGLSIGFETLNRKMVEGVRHLTELKLFEVSLCLFPMNEQAEVYGFKSREKKDDFLEELGEAQAMAFRYMAMQALSESLCETISDSDLMPAEVTAQSSVAIQQFHDKYIEMIPMMLAAMAEQSMGSMYYSNSPTEAKVGRRISSATRKKMEEAISQLQALLAEAAGDSTSGDGAAIPNADMPKENHIEPEQFHSLLDGFTKSLIGDLKNGTERTARSI